MNVIQSTFDTKTTEGKLRVFNATNGASQSLKAAIGEVIEVQDILIYADTIQGFGGAEPSEATLVAFFTPTGEVYAGVSSVAGKAASNLIDMMIDDEDIKPKITFVQGTSKGGQSFVNLQIVSL